MNEIKDVPGSTFSNLPLCLGGLTQRQAAYSFGIGFSELHNESPYDILQPTKRLGDKFELVERLGNSEGSINTFNMNPPSDKSLSDLITDKFPSFKNLLSKY